MDNEKTIKLLRSCFEIGISYNLIIGGPIKENVPACHSEKKYRQELLDFERGLLDRISVLAPKKQVEAAVYLLRAFRLGHDFHTNTARLHLLLPADFPTAPMLYCIRSNWPCWSWDLLCESTQKLLAPEKLIELYYKLRKTLQTTDELCFDSFNPTLKKLNELRHQKVLSASLIRYRYRIDPAGMAHVNLVGLERYIRNGHQGRNSKQSYVQSGRREALESEEKKIHFRLMKMAADLARGDDPLNKVPEPLLTKHKFTQWGKILLSVHCQYHNISANDFCNAQYARGSSHLVPKAYKDIELNDHKKIEYYYKHLYRRYGHLRDFFYPEHLHISPDSEVKLLTVLKDLGEEKALQVILSHWLMLYLSILKHGKWLQDIQQLLSGFRQIRGERGALRELLMNIRNPYLVLSPELLKLEMQIVELRDSNPTNLPMGWFADDLLPAPLSLLEKTSDIIISGRKVKSWESQEWQHLLQSFTPEKTLHIPVMLNVMQINMSAWLRKMVMLREPDYIKKRPLSVYSRDRIDAATMLEWGADLLAQKYSFTSSTLKQLRPLPLNELMALLMGVSHSWYEIEHGKLSVDGLLDVFSKSGIAVVSNKTLRKRIQEAKQLLDHWPNVSHFIKG